MHAGRCGSFTSEEYAHVITCCLRLDFERDPVISGTVAVKAIRDVMPLEKPVAAPHAVTADRDAVLHRDFAAETAWSEFVHRFGTTPAATPADVLLAGEDVRPHRADVIACDALLARFQRGAGGAFRKPYPAGGIHAFAFSGRCTRVLALTVASIAGRSCSARAVNAR